MRRLFVALVFLALTCALITGSQFPPMVAYAQAENVTLKFVDVNNNPLASGTTVNIYAAGTWAPTIATGTLNSSGILVPAPSLVPGTTYAFTTSTQLAGSFVPQPTPYTTTVVSYQGTPQPAGTVFVQNTVSVTGAFPTPIQWTTASPLPVNCVTGCPGSGGGSNVTIVAPTDGAGRVNVTTPVPNATVFISNASSFPTPISWSTASPAPVMCVSGCSGGGSSLATSTPNPVQQPSNAPAVYSELYWLNGSNWSAVSTASPMPIQCLLGCATPIPFPSAFFVTANFPTPIPTQVPTVLPTASAGASPVAAPAVIAETTCFYTTGAVVISNLFSYPLRCDSGGNLLVNLQTALPAGSNVIGAVTQNGSWTVQQGGAPWSVSQSGSWVVSVASTPLPVSTAAPAPTSSANPVQSPTSAPQTIALHYWWNGTNWVAVSATSPLPVTTAAPGTYPTPIPTVPTEQSTTSPLPQATSVPVIGQLYYWSGTGWVAVSATSPLPVLTPAPVATVFISNTPGVICVSGCSGSSAATSSPNPIQSPTGAPQSLALNYWWNGTNWVGASATSPLPVTTPAPQATVFVANQVQPSPLYTMPVTTPAPCTAITCTVTVVGATVSPLPMPTASAGAALPAAAAPVWSQEVCFYTTGTVALTNLQGYTRRCDSLGYGGIDLEAWGGALISGSNPLPVTTPAPLATIFIANASPQPLPTASAGAATPVTALPVYASMACLFPAGVAPTVTAGNMVVAQCDTNGNQLVNLKTALPAGTNIIGALVANQSVNVAQVGGTSTANGGLAGSQSVGGTGANNAAITQNPLLVGCQSVATGATPAPGTAGDLRQATCDLAGARYVRNGSPFYFNCDVNAVGTTAVQCEALVTGAEIYVTDIEVGAITAASTFAVEYGTGTACASGATKIFPANATVSTYFAPLITTSGPAQYHFNTPIFTAASNELCVIGGSATDTIDFQAQGYIAP